MEGSDEIERSKYLNTFEFIDKVAYKFEARLVHGEVEEVESSLSTSHIALQIDASMVAEPFQKSKNTNDITKDP